MNVYRGIGRRQVGNGIWSTIQRGFRPLLSTIARTLKPHAISAGKRALGVGTNIAMDALSGNINKGQIKQVLKDEAIKLRDEAKEKMSDLKRRCLDIEPQEGSGRAHKRRRTSRPKSSNKKMTKRIAHKRKGSKKSKCKGDKPKCKQYKRRSGKSKTKKGRITKRKRRSVSRKAVKDIFG